ncbi:hypothetical protein [Streptomyces erythrochromogenes]|uniref:hypothetical protein n=1 Tax=Streptomyces erythrochromogenes TaxID=285574 RepID=UPI0037F13C61
MLIPRPRKKKRRELKKVPRSTATLEEFDGVADDDLYPVGFLVLGHQRWVNIIEAGAAYMARIHGWRNLHLYPGDDPSVLISLIPRAVHTHGVFLRHPHPDHGCGCEWDDTWRMVWVPATEPGPCRSPPCGTPPNWRPPPTSPTLTKARQQPGRSDSRRPDSPANVCCGEAGPFCVSGWEGCRSSSATTAMADRPWPVADDGVIGHRPRQRA